MLRQKNIWLRVRYLESATTMCRAFGKVANRIISILFPEPSSLSLTTLWILPMKAWVWDTQLWLKTCSQLVVISTSCGKFIKWNLVERSGSLRIHPRDYRVLLVSMSLPVYFRVAIKCETFSCNALSPETAKLCDHGMKPWTCDPKQAFHWNCYH